MGKEGECAQGVTVKLSGDGLDLETVTDLFGDFEFEGLENYGSYTVTVSTDGYVAKELECKMFKDVNLGEIILEPK